MEKRYFECKNCGQVVQGINASESIQCCEHPDYVEITDEYEAEAETADNDPDARQRQGRILVSRQEIEYS